MKYLPQWTRRVVMEGTGRDPLGLSRVSDALTDFLLPYIITTTDRARYYSFYTWAISDIGTSKKSFEEEFQRREAAFALASRLGHNTNFSIVGVRQVDLARAAAGDTINTAFLVLPSNPSGGFGQYYSGCLAKLGLVNFDEEGEPSVSSERGRAIADSFASATAKAPYLTGDWRNKVRVPMEVLQTSSSLFSLDAIRARAAAKERDLLIRLFFSLGERPSGTKPLNCQATLGQFLHVMKAYEEAGFDIEKSYVDRSIIFWPHYYGNLYADNGRPRSYMPVPAFSEVHAFWRQFCLHQFFTYALEEFLAGVLEALSPHPEGLTEPALLDVLLDNAFVKDLNHALGSNCSRPADLLSALGVRGLPDVLTSQKVAQMFGARNPLNEWAIYEAEKPAPQTSLGRAMLLLAMLYAKWRGRDDDEAFRHVSEHAQNELWVASSFEWHDACLEQGLDWRAVCKQLLHFMLIRHDQVKFQKRNLEASWLELAGGRYLKVQDIKPDFRTSRHESAAVILYDLGLLDFSPEEETWHLTAEGKRILNEVMRLRS